MTDALSQSESVLLEGYSQLEERFPPSVLVHKLTAFSRTDQLTRATRELLDLRRQLGEGSLSPSEVSHTRDALVASLQRQAQLSAKDFYYPRLAHESAVGATPLTETTRHGLYTEMLASFRFSEIQQAMRQWMSDSELHVFIESNSEAAEGETLEKLQDTAAQVNNEPSVSFQVSPIAPELLSVGATLPSNPGTATGLSRIPGTKAWQWELSNGATVFFVPDRANPPLTVASYSPGGLTRLGAESALNFDALDAWLAAGLGRHSGATLRKWRHDHGIELRPWMANYAEGVRGTANLPEPPVSEKLPPDPI